MDQELGTAEQYTAAVKVLEATGTSNTSTLDELTHDDYIYHIRTASLGGLGHPEGLSKTEHLKLKEELKKEVSGHTFGPLQEVVQAQDKIAFLVESVSTLTTGHAITNERMFIVSFHPGTSKIIKSVEMLDSLLLSQSKDESPVFAAHLPKA